MFQKIGELSVQTAGRQLYDVTERIAAWVADTGLVEGLMTLYIRHTSASLLIQENADPEVLRDMERFFNRLVPQGDPLFRHTAEGPDDMPAHVRAALTAVSLSIPVKNGALLLGTWQGIFLYEHRSARHTRVISCHLIGT
ncbi:MAG: secondary thiamine-phosphate synthase enzyme YjbQ [Nitrospiria bacterium]